MQDLAQIPFGNQPDGRLDRLQDRFQTGIVRQLMLLESRTVPTIFRECC